MGINPTLPNYKSFTFGGVNSRNYGVYITGEAVFNAPERNVEMIEIPGRNGAYALDKGNFNNIEVTYPAGIFADTETDFAEAVSDLRNFLCSQSGYVRLEDDYNTGEYRLAIYKSGLEVSHEMLIAGEFDIVFECKPQRFLTSGETATSVASGGTLSNPTLFDSHPLLEIYGYGDMSIGGDTLSVDNVMIGNIKVANGGSSMNQYAQLNFSDTYANSGDTITLGTCYCQTKWRYEGTPTITDASCTATGTGVTAEGAVQSQATKALTLRVTLNADGALSFAYGTSASVSASASVSIDLSNGNTVTGSISVTLSYDGDHKISIGFSQTLPSNFTSNTEKFSKIGAVNLDSTQSALNPAYIDLDIGECYKLSGTTMTSINNAVSLPSELPTLKPGSNTITYDNTFTSVKVTPRWWKV